MQNLVSGSTIGGGLWLYQNAPGGTGGEAFLGSGVTAGTAANGGYAESDVGNASSYYVDSNASYVSVNTSATGGDGGATDNGTAGTGGNATATAFVESGAASSTYVSATATGGAGGEAGTYLAAGGVAGNGGTASVTAYGQSDIGQYVSVSAQATGGAGGEGDSGVTGGAGASETLYNQVSGSTTGELDLAQTATRRRWRHRLFVWRPNFGRRSRRQCVVHPRHDRQHVRLRQRPDHRHRRGGWFDRWRVGGSGRNRNRFDQRDGDRGRGLRHCERHWR